MTAKLYGFDRSFLHDTTERDPFVIDMVRAEDYLKLEAQVAALQEQLSSHSMSAGQADQRKAESDAVRVALGFSADADDISPSDLIREIVSLKNKALYLRSDRDEWERRSISNFNNCAEMDKQLRALAAENSIQDFIISAVKDLVSESEGVAGWHLNGDIASWDEALPELNHSETPATNAALREIRAQAVDSFSEDCKVKSSKESHVFWMDASSAAEEFAARIRAGEPK